MYVNPEATHSIETGFHTLAQAFNWESHRQKWWQKVAVEGSKFATLGFTVVWLPPPTASVAPQGYMPLDLYNLNSAYGSEEDLRRWGRSCMFGAFIRRFGTSLAFV